MTRKTDRGLLIAIEGIDGAGKTTQSQLLCEKLASLRFEPICTKEPTSGRWGQLLRDSAQRGRLSPQEELNAFIEDRKEHVSTLIRPSLAMGKVVIIDRYYFSTAAYQGAHGMDPDQLIEQNESFAPEPDLLIVLDLPPRIGLQRIAQRGDIANHFENEAGLTKCRAIFSGLQKPYLVRVDAEQPVDVIAEKILHNFYRVAAEQFGHDPRLSAKEQLDGVLQLYGGQPV